MKTHVVAKLSRVLQGTQRSHLYSSVQMEGIILGHSGCSFQIIIFSNCNEANRISSTR